MARLQAYFNDHVYHQIHDSKDIGKINERIKALLDVKKYEHVDKASQHLRLKNKQAKIKRTRQLRKNHILNISEKPYKPQSKQIKKLSIDTLRYHPNPKPAPDKQDKQWYMNQLQQFQQDFSNGKIDQKYEQMLGEYIDQYNDAIEGDREEFIKRATKTIKEKLFAFYMQEYNRTAWQKMPQSSDRKQMTLSSHQYGSIETHRSKQMNKHIRMRSEDFLHKYNLEHKRRATACEIPYILKSPTKFNKIHAQGIQQSYLTQMETIEYAKKVNDKKRKMKEQAFLLRLKEVSHPALGKK